MYFKSKNQLNEKIFSDFYDDENYISGSYELEILKGNEKIENKQTFLLNKGIELFYNRDASSIIVITDFFKNNKALESLAGFEEYIFGQDYFDESKLAGLSILLMRDTNSIEAVKFGMLITRYYQLENIKGAVEIIDELSIFPEFTYYALKGFENLKDFEERRLKIKENAIALGKEIEENYK